jgi:hypothetical protein
MPDTVQLPRIPRIRQGVCRMVGRSRLRVDYQVTLDCGGAARVPIGGDQANRDGLSRDADSARHPGCRWRADEGLMADCFDPTYLGDGVSWRGADAPAQLRVGPRRVADSPAYDCRSPPVSGPVQPATRREFGGGPTQSASPAYGRTCPLDNEHEWAPELVR